MGPDIIDPPEPPDARRFLRLVWRRKWLILLGAAVGAALGLIYAVLSPAAYQTGAQVLVVQKRPEAFTGTSGQTLPQEDYLSTQQGLLKTPLVLQRAIPKHQLATLR